MHLCCFAELSQCVYVLIGEFLVPWKKVDKKALKWIQSRTNSITIPHKAINIETLEKHSAETHCSSPLNLPHLMRAATHRWVGSEALGGRLSKVLLGIKNILEKHTEIFGMRLFLGFDFWGLII